VSAAAASKQSSSHSSLFHDTDGDIIYDV